MESFNLKREASSLAIYRVSHPQTPPGGFNLKREASSLAIEMVNPHEHRRIEMFQSQARSQLPGDVVLKVGAVENGVFQSQARSQLPGDTC